MRLGGPISERSEDPDGWIAAVKALGYRAAVCPVGPDASSDVIRAFEGAAQEADVVIAEVGAWSNPLSPDDEERCAALEKCKRQLDLADRIGARCCVNIAGSLGRKWDGPDVRDLSEEAFDRVVACVREIIDAVRPRRTFYTLETMPWMVPHSTDSYLRVLEAVDRDRFAVHFDPVNLINSPERYAATGALIRDFVSRLGDRIRSCHAKDIVLRKNLTVHLDEVGAGQGNLDYPELLRQLNRLDPDTPLMLEHLKTPEEYAAAAAFIRGLPNFGG